MNTKFENINILSMKLGFPQTGKFKECLLFSNKVISCLCEKQHFTFILYSASDQRFFVTAETFRYLTSLRRKKQIS